MKKLIAIALILGFVFTAANVSFAGEREWATAGKILTGMVGLSILADAASTPSYSYGHSYHHAPRPVYRETYYSRPYYRPRPVSYTYEEVTRCPRRYERRVRRYYY